MKPGGPPLPDPMGSTKSNPPSPAKPKPWFVYLLRCANGGLYTGITTDMQKRLDVHNSGKGSAYVRAHRPAKLVAFTASENRSSASVLEYFVKSLGKSEKLALAKTWQAALRKPQQPRRTRATK